MDDQRPAREPGGHAAGARSIAAHAQHHGGTQPQHDAQRLRHGQADLERRREARRQGLAAQAADGDPLDIDAGRRHHARFQPQARAHPHHFQPARAQGLGHRQGREHVPASTACHDQHASTHERFLGRAGRARPSAVSS